MIDKSFYAHHSPTFLYGTAWKKENTKELTKKALQAGFRGIDTANQKKHYREDYVGQALLEMVNQGIERSDLYLQSKFTYAEGHDHRLPYDPQDSLTDQVRSSFNNTLENLHTDYLDAYILHGPSAGDGIHDPDWEVWDTMEDLYKTEQTRMIGVSNVNLEHIVELTEQANIEPMIVQNRCFADRGWDKEIREHCIANEIIYQGFALLTGNQAILEAPRLIAIAKLHNATPEQVIFRFAIQLGIIPITGTTNVNHMKQDLEIYRFELSEKEMIAIETITD